MLLYFIGLLLILVGAILASIYWIHHYVRVLDHVRDEYGIDLREYEEEE